MRIRQIDYSTAPAATQRAHDDHLRIARITNMKRTLLRSVPAFDALMTWYTLRDATIPILGERLTTIFAHAISAETDCLICSTFFHRILIDSGEDPDHLALDAREQAVVSFGRRLAKSPFTVPDEIFAPMRELFDEVAIVTITAFGAAHGRHHRSQQRPRDSARRVPRTLRQGGRLDQPVRAIPALPFRAK